MVKKTKLKSRILYSEELRRHIVSQIENGDLTVSQAVREYAIGSPQSVYNWMYKYSRTLKKGICLVMEKDSHQKTNEDLRKQIKELEAALGRKTMEADLYRIIVEQASKELEMDLKKNFGEQVSKRSDK